MEMTHLRLPVTERSQVAAARMAIRDLALRAGGSEEDAHRAGLVATELATNLVKHTPAGGELLARSLPSLNAGAVEMLSLDAGPGIADLPRALSDGHSTAGTAGGGLGAVRRLSDRFDIYSRPGKGTAVVAQIGSAPPRQAPQPFDVGAVAVAHPGETVLGDGWAVDLRADDLRLLVADGLGHGPGAHDAAMAVLSAFAGRRSTHAAQILEEIHRAVAHTRGAATAIATLRRHGDALAFAGVGNISGVISLPGSQRQAVSQNGTVGHAIRSVREYRYPWSSQAVFVMHSDGLSSHWTLDQYPGLHGRHPSLIAGVLYRDFSRHRDDVTVVVVREAT
jgi:anti-sigma regulatory factor (Ser/Thr protein kinase)